MYHTSHNMRVIIMRHKSQYASYNNETQVTIHDSYNNKSQYTIVIIMRHKSQYTIVIIMRHMTN